MSISKKQDRYFKLQELVRRECLSHNMFTPMELVDEIIESCSDKLTEDAEVLVLFNPEFAVSLLEDYPFLQGQVTLYHEDDPIIEKLSQAMGINTVTSLEDNMKFDLVLGNPPYQHPTNGRWKLWVEFTDFAIQHTEVGGSIAMLTPTSWINAFTGVELLRAKGLISSMQIVTHKEVDVFDVSENIGYWVVHKPMIGQPVNNSGFFKKHEKYSTRIIRKCGGNNYPFVQKFSNPKRDEVVGGPLVCYHTHTQRFNVADNGRWDNQKNCFKLIINKSGKYVSEVFNKNTVCGVNASSLQFKTKKEAVLAKGVFDSKLFRFVNASTKTSGFNNFDILPEVDLSRPWTDAELYAHFGLSEEEIAYVESNVE